MAFKPDEYIDLELTLIGYIESSVIYMSGVMRHIRNDTNTLEMM